ncbi:hypothetical protein KY285_024041 [Solanum tuberosum]|nr:hypothetical protein KY285_024041 [Solanum tuberosum]
MQLKIANQPNGILVEGTTSGSHKPISSSSKGRSLKEQHGDKGKGTGLDYYNMEESRCLDILLYGVI